MYYIIDVFILEILSEVLFFLFLFLYLLVVLVRKCEIAFINIIR